MLPVVGRRGLPAPVPLVLAHTSENVRFSLHLKQSDCSFSTTAAKTSNPPLKHIRLVELAGVLAGPTCGQFFAELGAEVIKIENPRIGGDVTRGWKLRPYDTEPSSYFQGCNLGKKSLSINLKNDDDKRTLHNLIRTADIVTVSYKPGDAEKLEVDYDTLRKLNPKLIYVQITGYGLDSGDHRPGYDACIQAESGFQFMNGEKGGLPVKMPVAMVDLLAAHQMKQGILLALLQRERENKGKLITVSLLKSAVVSCANQASGYLLAGKIPQRIGSDHPSIVPYGTVYFDEDNKPFVLAVGTDVQFRSLLIDVLGVVSRVPEKWKRNVQRVDDKEAVNELLQGEFSKTTRSDVLDRCRNFSVPAGAVKNMQEVFEHPEAMSAVVEGKWLSQIGWNEPRAEGLLPPPAIVGEHDSEFK